MFAVHYQCDSTQKCFNIVPSGHMFLYLPMDVLQAIVQNMIWAPLQEHPEKTSPWGALQMTCASLSFVLSSGMSSAGNNKFLLGWGLGNSKSNYGCFYKVYQLMAAIVLILASFFWFLFLIQFLPGSLLGYYYYFNPATWYLYNPRQFLFGMRLSINNYNNMKRNFWIFVSEQLGS